MRPMRSATLSASDERAPSTADKVSAVRLASALTRAAFSLRSFSVARSVTSSMLFCSSEPPLGEALDQRPRGFVEDLRHLGRASREHGIEFAGVGADRLGGVVGALADMLANRGEGLRDHIGARNELRLGIRHLLVEPLADRLGGVGEAVLDAGDLLLDTGGRRRRARCKSLVGAGKRLLDFAGMHGQFLTGQPGTFGDPLLGVGECPDDGLGMLADRRRAVGDARHQALIRFVEDATDLGRTARQGFRTFGDARDQLLVGGIENAAEVRCTRGERLGQFADAHTEPLVGAFEVAQDVAGAGGQRLCRFDGARNQFLVRRVECAGDLACTGRQMIRGFLGPGGQLVGGFLGAGGDLLVRHSKVPAISPARAAS